MVLKYTEPADKAVSDPESGDKEWCLFKFVNDIIADPRPFQLTLKSSFLFGSDAEICDLFIERIDL